jgi:hypothetical protein
MTNPRGGLQTLRVLDYPAHNSIARRSSPPVATMMKTAGLKPSRRVSVQPFEAPLPICDPTFDRESFVYRRAKKV